MNIFHLLPQMGGVAMLSLAVATTPALMGVGYAIWPTESKLALMRPLSLASIFAAFGGAVGGLINLLRSVVVHNQSISSPDAMVAFSECLVPLFVSFGSLTIAWLLVALGMRRVS